MGPLKFFDQRSPANIEKRSRPPSARLARLSFLWALLFWLAVWQLVSLWVGRTAGSFSSLSRPRAVGIDRSMAVLGSAGMSLLRVLEGFGLGIAAGVAMAGLTLRFSAARSLLAPLLKVIRATPVASFIILALVWLPTGRIPGFISMLMVAPVVWASMEKGVQETDPLLLEMAQLHHMGRWRTLRWIWGPSVAPYLLTACTTGLGFAWKSGVAAEVICRPLLSIGKNLQEAKLYLETPEVFAWTITVAVLSLALEKLLMLAAKRVQNRPKERGEVHAP